MTIQNTPVYALPYPQGGDPADAPSQLQALATRIETVLAPIDTQSKAKDSTLGLLSARPLAAVAGKRYFATDVVADYVDTGTAWLRTSLPAGSTMAILAAAAPSGWLLCDGTAIPNSGATVELFAAIGATRPDLRGRVPVGVDGAAARLAANDALANSGGVESYALAQTELPAHVHAGSSLTIAGGTHDHALQTAGGLIAPGASGYSGIMSKNSGTGVGSTQDATHTHTVGGNTGSTGSSIAHQNMQPFQIVNWIVKL